MDAGGSFPLQVRETPGVNFASDNVSGAAPEILEALTAANAGNAMPYGSDPVTRRLEALVADVFEREATVFPVATGTAANALALQALIPPYGAVYCHRESHINVDECGAPEFFTGGAKLVALDGPHGKLQPHTVAAALTAGVRGMPHRVKPAALSLTQATEAGTVYSIDEIATLADVAARHGLAVHLDGARFANAVAALGVAPAELTWRAGVDVLCLGGTKNGCLAAEAVVFFDPAQAEDFAYRRKRGGQLLSKHRFVAAQLNAYLRDGLWLRLADHANAQAQRLAAGLEGLPGLFVVHPVEANEVFLRAPSAVVAGLEEAGIGFAPWDEGLIRLVTSFDTDPAAVDRLLAELSRLTAAVADEEPVAAGE